jgi:hypothetical protein
VIQPTLLRANNQEAIGA